MVCVCVCVYDLSVHKLLEFNLFTHHRDEFKRLAVEDKLGLSTAKYENPHWKAPEEKPVVTSVIRDGRNGREGLDGASKGLPKVFIFLLCLPN